jgi:hypothetical protein
MVLGMTGDEPGEEKGNTATGSAPRGSEGREPGLCPMVASSAIPGLMAKFGQDKRKHGTLEALPCPAVSLPSDSAASISLFIL